MWYTAMEVISLRTKIAELRPKNIKPLFENTSFETPTQAGLK